MNRRNLLQSLLSTAALAVVPGASVVAKAAPTLASSEVINIQDYAYLVYGKNWTDAFNAAIRDAVANNRKVYAPPFTEYQIEGAVKI